MFQIALGKVEAACEEDEAELEPALPRRALAATAVLPSPPASDRRVCWTCCALLGTCLLGVSTSLAASRVLPSSDRLLRPPANAGRNATATLQIQIASRTAEAAGAAVQDARAGATRGADHADAAVAVDEAVEQWHTVGASGAADPAGSIVATVAAGISGDLAARPLPEIASDLHLGPGEWKMENTCVALDNRRPFFIKGRHRIRAPRFFTEYAMDLQDYVTTNGSMTCHEVTRPLAFMAVTTHNANLFHVFHHAIPMAEFFHRAGLKMGSQLMVLPMVDGAPFDGGEILRPIARWDGYYLLLRALGDRREQSVLQEELTTYLEPGWCGCFSKILGGHTLFNPAAPHVAPRVRVFRHKIAESFSLRAEPKGHTLIFTLRHTKARRVINEKELVESLGPLTGEASAFDMSFVDWGRMTLRDQVATIISAQILVGVHGQGLVHTMMLPTDAFPCALVEIFPAAMAEHDYYDWSLSNGVQYYRIGEKPVYKCWSVFRHCGDIIIDIGRFRKAIEKVAVGLLRGPKPDLILYTVPAPPQKALLDHPREFWP